MPRTARASDVTFTVADVAAHFDVSSFTVLRWIDLGALGAEKVGREYRISPSQLAAFVAGHIVTSIDQELPMVPAQKPLPLLERLFSLKEVAEVTGISLRVLEDEARARRFEHVHIGASRRMTRDQVRALIAQHTVRPEAAADPLAADRARMDRRFARRKAGAR